MNSMLKKIMTLAIAAFVAMAASAQVKPGVETLRDGNFAQLQGKRVGLLTNPSGVDNNLVSTIDILANAPGVKLTALYSPEHGVRGDVHAGDHVATYVDEKTGVRKHLTPVFLYRVFRVRGRSSARIFLPIAGNHL